MTNDNDNNNNNNNYNKLLPLLKATQTLPKTKNCD